MRDGEGAIVKWFGSSIDIQDRKRAEEAIRQNEKDSQQLIDTVPQRIGVLSPDGRQLFANKAALESPDADCSGTNCALAPKRKVRRPKAKDRNQRKPEGKLEKTFP